MSAIEKLFVQIFDRKKSIIDQARHQCHLFDQHLVSKLLIDGIVPPPWLSNPVLSSHTSDPTDLNEDDLIFGALFPRPQSTIPFSGGLCSQYSNPVVTTDDGQLQSGLHSEFHALKKDSDAVDGLSNLAHCSVNNVAHSSTSAPEMDSGAISPQNQMESRISHSYNDPAMSLAKLQRSKSRQRALEVRNSAKAAKSCSGDDDKAGLLVGRRTGSATSSLQLDHTEGSDVVKAFYTNIQNCAMEEGKKCGRLTHQNEQSNYSGRITRSKILAQKLSTLNVDSSSLVKEDGPKSNNVIEPLEQLDSPSFMNGSCRAKGTNKGDSQRKETERNVHHKILTRSGSTSQAKCDNELLKLDATLARDNDVEVRDSMLPLSNVELAVLSKAPDHGNESQRKTTKDGDCWNDKQEKNVHCEIRRLPGSFCQSPSDDVLMTGGSLKSISKSTQSPQPLVSHLSQASAVPVIGSFHSQKDPDLCAVKPREVNNIGGSSSRQKDCKLDTEMAMDSAEVTAANAYRNTRAVTTCTTEGSLRAVNSSNLDGRDSRHIHSDSNKTSVEKSVHVETVVAEKALDTQENIISGVNVTGNIEDRSATTFAQVDVDYDGLVEKNSACSGFVPKVGLDVSDSRLPSDFVMSVKPKQLDFDDVKELSMNGLSSSDLKVRGQGIPSEKGPVTSLEQGNLLDKVTSLISQDKCNFSSELHLLERLEFMIREEGSQIKSCESHLKEANAARKTLHAKSSQEELPVVQKELCAHTVIENKELPKEESFSTNHSIPSQVACEKSSGSFPKEVMASKFVSENSNLKNVECNSAILGNALFEAVTGNDLLGNAVETVTDLTVGFPSASLMDELNSALTHQVPGSGISLHQHNNLSMGNELSDEKDAGFSTEFQVVKNSMGSFASDMEHSCPQHKRRKFESQAERSQPASPSLLEKPHESSNQRLVSGNLNIKEDSQEVAQEVQHLTSHNEDIENLYVLTEERQNTKGCLTTEGSSLKVRAEEKFNLDERDGSVETRLTFTSNDLGESLLSCLTEQRSNDSHNCLTEQMVVANLSGFGIGSTRRCTIDKKLDSWHAERSNSRKRIFPREKAKFSDGSPVSGGIQSSDLIGPDETIPELEGFIIQPDDAQACTGGDQIELEKLNLPSDTIEYASILEHLGNSAFKRSPLCRSSNPYRFYKIPDLYQSLPNGLVEGMGMRTSFPLNDENGKSLSDCLPNRKGQSTWDFKKPCASPIQTLWDRLTSNFGSSGKRESLKPELPCISEENETADEIANTFQKEIVSEVTTRSTGREPLVEITDNANPCQDDILAHGRGLDSVNREFSFGGTHNQVEPKLEKENSGRRRFTSKGKENQSISLGTNRAKRTTESVCNMSSRSKLSGKVSMKKGPTYSGGNSTRTNIVSNISSFIPLVQQKQAAAVITGKRDIKVKALETAEAAKRMAEKKENERKMKKEALRLKRERMEQHNLRQLELQNRKKGEERKKKEAEMEVKKRQREEEDRKEKERKKKRVDDAKRKQQEREEKICAKKEEKQTKCRVAGEGIHKKESIDERENCKNLENNREGNMKIPLAEPLTIKNPTNGETKKSFLEYSEVVNDCGNTGKVIGNTIKVTGGDDLIVQNTLQEQSYEISPYKESDDEDEDEDGKPNNKFIPSWASKHRLSLVISSQKTVDPETIFPPESFCNIAEVLLPRKLQVK